MKDLIREIRTRLNLNQEQFASLLGTTPVTISRWENGKSEPNTMAQKQIYDIVSKNNIDLSGYLVEKETSSEETLLYHASREGIKGQIRPISRSKCDFGKGFYMGTNPLQPLTLVCDEESPVFYTLSLDLKDLKELYVDASIKWAMMIAFNRGYIKENTRLYDEYSHMMDGYDLIVGYIADDRMYQVMSKFFDGEITDAVLSSSLSALNLGKQYVAITEKACDKITILKSRKLSRLELMILSDKNEKRREEGKRLADEMTRLHRREGRYFDEILEGDK